MVNTAVAVGEISTRLTAKALLATVTMQMTPHLRLPELGFGTPNGCDGRRRPMPFWTMDLENSFTRSTGLAFCEKVRTVAPSLARHSRLVLHERQLPSRWGVQQRVPSSRVYGAKSEGLAQAEAVGILVWKWQPSTLTTAPSAAPTNLRRPFSKASSEVWRTQAWA